MGSKHCCVILLQNPQQPSAVQSTTIEKGQPVVLNRFVFAFQLLENLLANSPRGVVPHPLLEYQMLDNAFWRAIARDTLTPFGVYLQTLSHKRLVR
jgi:hypothetical protein